MSNKTEYKYSSEWINKLEDNYHWNLYWWQQKLIYDYIKPNTKALEIGIGTKFASNYLKSKGVNVKTIDIDIDKKPDIVANIVDYKLNEKFDFVLAFEIFEHIPYNEFIQTLNNIKNNTDFVFMSLPILKKKVFEIKLLIPVFHHLSFNIFLPKKKITTKNHFWEIGKNSVSMNKLKNDIINSGYKITNTITFDSFIYFVLKTNS